MPLDVQQYGLGLIGAGPFSHHLLDRLLLREEMVAVAVCPGDRKRSGLGPSCEVYEQPQDVVNCSRTQIVYFADAAPVELVESAIRQRRVVVLSDPTGLSAADLNHLAGLAAANQSIAVVEESRRCDDDFQSAKLAFDLGHLGQLERIRVGIHETALPGERFATGVLRELGYHWLDQLLVFATGQPQLVALRKFCNPDRTCEVGFLAQIDFLDGISAVVEVQTTSLLSLRTGWLLEGTAGAYRAGRRYSKTADGEIVDEPIPAATTSGDPFLDNLVKAMAGDQFAVAALVPLSHAARTMAVVEQLEAATTVS